MSMSKQEILYANTSFSPASSKTNLNPYASEFVPFALRAPSEGSNRMTNEKPRHDFHGLSEETLLDHSEPDFFGTTDGEALEDWNHQLPDDISPDFKGMNEDKYHEILPLAALSLNTCIETSSNCPSSEREEMLSDFNELCSVHSNTEDLAERKRHQTSLNNEEFLYTGGSAHQTIKDMLRRPMATAGCYGNPLEYLTFHFPGFAVESLLEVYIANKYDLKLTIEMLTQLELQVEGELEESIKSRDLLSPKLSRMDFPALSFNDNQSADPKYCGEEVEQCFSNFMALGKRETLECSSVPSRCSLDFASAVRKALEEPDTWKRDSCGGGTWHGGARGSDKLPSRSSCKVAPAWLETGVAVSNLYSELREEARDHARIRNAYLEQARHAYLVGNKALAKELSIKGQLYNMRMKAAHEKAQEAIYRRRNPNGSAGGERLIDLHGLHTSEAIRVLRHELGVLRTIARSAEKRMEVCICVGTGHHTRGSRTPARLPAAVQRFLLEDEGLHFTEPQPGLLRVSLY